MTAFVKALGILLNSIHYWSILWVYWGCVRRRVMNRTPNVRECLHSFNDKQVKKRIIHLSSLSSLRKACQNSLHINTSRQKCQFKKIEIVVWNDADLRPFDEGLGLIRQCKRYCDWSKVIVLCQFTNQLMFTKPFFDQLFCKWNYCVHLHQPSLLSTSSRSAG